MYPAKLKDGFLEAIAFGIVNFLLTWPLIRLVVESAASPSGFTWTTYLAGVGAYLVVPVMLALGLDWALSILENWGFILRRPKSGWDAFFLTREPAKILVHLKGGALLGGQLGKDSYAGLHPYTGHLYIEKAWKLTEEGKFDSPLSDSLGIILRPEDYDFVELLVPDPAATEPAATENDEHTEENQNDG